MFKRSSPPVVMIRNVVGSFRPMHRNMGYCSGIWLGRLLRKCHLWMSIGLRTFGGAAILWTSTLRANPVGEQVVGGAATFNRPDAATLLINQQTDRAVINWVNFSIGHGELTHFVQPSSASAALNRVVTLSPSLIDGALRANGQVWLSNPNGIMVGKGGTVNVGSFLATTHGIQTDDFMRGGDVNLQSQSDAAILNQGKIEARDGDVFLVAKEVKNEGQLMARDGTVGMVSGTEVSLQSLGAGKYKVRLLADESGNAADKSASDSAEIINEGVIEAANAVLEATGSYLPLAIRNDGTIRATATQANPDGSVSLIGGKGDVVNRGVVEALRENLSGKKEGGKILVAGNNITTDLASMITASGEDNGGQIKIDAKDTIYASGKILATASGGSGGRVMMTGDRIGLLQAKIDVSGEFGGGEALVGGDLSGANPEVRNANALFMSSDSDIRADAIRMGNGGKVILWSEEYTGFYGDISAQGGSGGGNGGFVETSARWNLQAWGGVDTSATVGRNGMWLLDPYNIYITTTGSQVSDTGTATNPRIFEAQAPDAQVNANKILDSINSGNSVVIQVGPQPTIPSPNPNNITSNDKRIFESGTQAGNIYVVRDINAPNSTGSLTLTVNIVASGDEAGSIFVERPITLGSGNLSLLAGDNRGAIRPLTSNLITDGGTGGSVFVNAALSTGGAITIKAGQSVTGNAGGSTFRPSGGQGGEVVINAQVTAGGGVTIVGGDADKSWVLGGGATIFTSGSSTLQVTSYNFFPNTDGYAPQTGVIQANGIAYVGRDGGTGGNVRINAPIVVGSGTTSVIRAGNAGINSAGGNLTINSPITGPGANLTLQSGSGTLPGTLTINSTAPIGVSGAGRFNQVTLSGNSVLTVDAGVYAATISLTPNGNAAAMWFGQNPVSGLSVFFVNNAALANLFADNLTIGSLQQTGDIAFGEASPITFNSANVTILGASAAVSFDSNLNYSISLPNGGTLTFNTGGAVYSNYGNAPADIYIPGGSVNFQNVTTIGNSTAPVLLNVANLSGTTSVAGNSYIQTAGAINLGTFNANNFSLNLVAGGSITQTPGTSITATGSANVFNASGGSVTLNNANNFGTVSFTSVSTAQINDVNSIILGAFALAGNLTVTAGGAISQSGPLTIGGTSSFTSTGGSITLGNSGNNFIGAVSLSGNNGITITDQNSLVLGNLTSSGGAAVTISMGGNLTQLAGTRINSSGIGPFNFVATAPGVSVDLASSENLFSPNVVLSGGANFQDFKLRNISSSAGIPTAFSSLSLRDLTLIYDNAGITMGNSNFNNVRGNLILTAGGSITQSLAITVGGTSTITSAGGSITLIGSKNNFVGSVSLITNQNASVTDANSIILGTSSVGGNLIVSTGAGLATGGITQSGALTVIGTTTFNSSAASTDIDLSTQANNLTGTVTIGIPENPESSILASNVRDFKLRNTSGTAGAVVNLGNSTTTKLRDLTINYDNAAYNIPSFTTVSTLRNIVISSGNEITQAAGGIFQKLSGAVSFTSLRSDIRLDTEPNDFLGAVSLTTFGDKNIFVKDINTLLLGDVRMGTTGIGQLSLETTLGSITQSGRTTISTGSGAVTITANDRSAITLNNDNDFRGPVRLEGGTTQIRDINNLKLGFLQTGSLTATSFGELNLGGGPKPEDPSKLSKVNGNLTATSNDGNITQTGQITMGAASFNAGKGSVTMTAGENGIPSNVYLGNIALRASSADFLVAQVNGVERLGQYAGSTVVTGKFTVRSPRDVLFNLSNGAGGFELTAAQLNNMNLGTLETRASGTGNLAVGTFNAPTIDGLNLVTEGTGNITAGSITVGTLGIDSGGTMTFARVGGLQNNRVRNLSNVTIAVGGFSFQNRVGLNLVGTLTMPGRTEMEIAGQFYNRTGIKSPLAGVQQGSVIKSLSLFGGFPQVSGLAGFNYRYDGVMPSTGNWMSYAVLPLAMYAPSGTVIAGVDLSGTPTGGGQLNTFFTGSNNLNWIVSDFGKFNLPEVSPARLEYMLYPQRVEPETRTLPLPTIQTLTRELGRPPTAGELNQRLASLEAKERQKDGVLFEKSSFDEEGSMPFEEARIPDQVMDGGKPQAGTDNPGIEPVLPCPPDSLSSQDRGVHLLAQQRVDTKKDPTSPMLKGVSKRAVALRDEPGDTENLIKSEREQAEVNLSEPVAGNR